MEKKNQLKSCCKKMLSSREVVARDLPHPMPLLNEEKQPCFMRKAEDPAQKPCGMTSLFDNGNNGFTLIELLVVVLIIGILAAVALPQYKKAVTKSRLATLKPMVESLTNAMETYYLTTNSYPSSFDELALDIPTPTSTETIGAKLMAYYPWGSCHMDVAPGQQFIACENSLSHIGYTRYLPTTTSYDVSRACYAHADNAVSLKVCQQDTGTTTPYFTGGDGYSGAQMKAYAYPN